MDTDVRRRLAGPAATLGVVGALITAVVVRDPHDSGAWGTCPVLLLTGYQCPGCGTLRGLHDIATGAWAEAWSHNALLFPVLAAAAWAWTAWTLRLIRTSRVRDEVSEPTPRHTPRQRVAVATHTYAFATAWVLLAWGVGRNL